MLSTFHERDLHLSHACPRGVYGSSMGQSTPFPHVIILNGVLCLQEGAPGGYRPEFRGGGGFGRGSAPP